MALLAKDHLAEPVGLKNDIVNQVFICPDCKTEVTISVYQVRGDLAIMCARCNMKWQIEGENLINPNAERNFGGFKVMVGADAAQKATPVPKDSYLAFINPPAPKPVAEPVAPADKPAV